MKILSPPLNVSVIVQLLFSLAFALLGFSAQAAEPVAPIQSATEYDYPPFSVISRDNQADGFSVELLRASLHAMGRDVQFKVGTWHDIKLDLAEGRIQALPMVARSAERAKDFDFTLPYLKMHGTIVVRKGEFRIQRAEDLHDKTIVVMKSDFAEEYVRENQLGKKVVTTPSLEVAFQQLAAGKYDAMVVQKLAGENLMRTLKLDNLEAVGPPLEHYMDLCFAVRKGDHELLSMLNEGLSVIIADGTLERLSEKWFVHPRDELIANMFKFLAAILGTLLLAGMASYLWMRSLRTQVHSRTVELRESEERFRLMFENNLHGVVFQNERGEIIYANKMAEEILGLTLSQMQGITSLDPLWRCIHEDGTDFPGNTHPAIVALQTGKPVHNEIMGVFKPGLNQIRWINVSAVPIIHPGESTPHIVFTTFSDITERKQAETDLSIAAAAFESQESLMITDAEGVILTVNQAFIVDTGYTAEEIVGQTTDLFKSGRHDAEFYKKMWESIHRNGSWQGEIWDRRKNGEIYPKLLTITAVKGKDGSVTHYVGSHTDITRKKQSEELIWKQANFDELTGLPNRSMFRDRMNMELTRASRSNLSVGLLFIDLDNFKEVNDTLGHDVGDVLLKESARRVRACVRELDTVSRLGGDEFTVIITEVPNTAHIEELAQKLIDQLSEPYHLGKEEIHISASVGISMYPSDATDFDAMMKAADQAMYAAKNQGRNCYSYFTHAMQVESQSRMQLGNELRLALKRQEFVLHYQPQINLETGRVTGLEALVRWQHPVRGLVPPGLFIPIAESNGLILPLGEWVISTACRQIKQWHEQGLSEICVSVNLSARQFRQATLAADVSRLLKETGLEPASLELEITESLAMENPIVNANTLSVLRGIGVALAMDDFGTGHSSLSYLKNFPFTRLKLDRSFIMNIETEPNDAIIVASAICHLPSALPMIWVCML